MINDARHPLTVEFRRLLSETTRVHLCPDTVSNIGRRITLVRGTRQMHLGVFVLGAGNHSAGWRWEGAAVSNNDLAVIQEIARIAERGKFDLLFVSDGLDYEPGDLPSFMCRFEPTSLISALSAHTSRLGLGATVSTSFTEPYNVARLFASIDHVSQGRAAWNVVTSSRPKAALNFSLDRQMDHELRYQRAEVFVDVVKGLWDCWEDGALVADKASGVYIDDSKIRPLDHKGRFFQVKGPMSIARCPQGHPVIIQAGGSPSGLELAARTADVVFSVVLELDSAKKAYADLKGRMAKYSGHRQDRGRGEGQARPAAELANPDQCPDPGDRPHRLRCQRLPARRTGTAAAAFRRRPYLPPRALRHGAAAEHDPAGTSTTLLPRRAATGSSAAPQLGLPTPLNSGLSRAPPTVTIYCRPISLAHSPNLST